MIVMNSDKKAIWKLDREDFIKAEIDERENGWNIFCWIRNADAIQPDRMRKKCWFGVYKTREKAEEVLHNLMVALAEDKFVTIEDEAKEEKES